MSTQSHCPRSSSSGTEIAESSADSDTRLRNEISPVLPHLILSDNSPPRFISAFRSRISWEIDHFKSNSSISEISGSFGDIGTFLPILLSLSLTSQTSFAASLVFAGLFNIVTGYIYRIPMCVQPMKAIASVGLSSSLTQNQISGAGITVGLVILILGITGGIDLVYRLVPIRVIRGVQMGTGMLLATRGVEMILKSNAWKFVEGRENSYLWMDNYLTALFALLIVLGFYNSKRTPSALILLLLGLVFAIIRFRADGMDKKMNVQSTCSVVLWNPMVTSPSWRDFKTGFWNAGLGQLPLTLLNSVIAVSKLADDLFPNHYSRIVPNHSSPLPFNIYLRPVASTTSVAITVGLMNLTACWFGSLPFCHGAGGLAAQYRFGARSEVSLLFLGILKIIAGLFFGSVVSKVLIFFPVSILGVMLVLSGIELACAAWDVEAVKEKKMFVVVVITAASIMGFKNDGVGFLVGMVSNGILEGSSRGWSFRRVAARIGHLIKTKEPQAAIAEGQ